MISWNTDVEARTEETPCSTNYMDPILLQDCTVPREDQFVPLLDNNGNLMSAGITVEGIYLFIEWLSL